MVRSNRRKSRNLNGLHLEVAPDQATRLPPPTTPLQDMKYLLGGQSISSLLKCDVRRHVLL